MNLQNLVRPFMYSGIGAIGVTALWAIIVVLTGTFDEFQLKVLATTMVIGFYSMTTAATFGEGKEYLVFGSAGGALAAVGVLMTVPAIWVWSYDAPVRAMLSIAVLAFGTAHFVINYRLASSSTASVVTMIVANVLVALTAFVIISLIMVEFRNIGEGIVRALIALGIANVAMTIINPIVSKMTRPSNIASA